MTHMCQLQLKTDFLSPEITSVKFNPSAVFYEYFASIEFRKNHEKIPVEEFTEESLGETEVMTI